MQFHVRPAIAAIALLSVMSTGYSYPSAAFAAASDELTAVDHSGGGHILRGSLGTQPSLKAATVALLVRVHTLFGSRPTVVKVFQNTAQHTVALVFRDTHAGKSVTGLSIVTAAPGNPASGAVVYDTTSEFAKTEGSLLHDLGAAPPAGGGGAQRSIALAPAEPLIAHPFADNTGTISVPANWTLKGAGGGSAVAIGPTGETVNYQYTQMADDPSYGLGKLLATGTGLYANPVLRSQALQSTALLPYTGDPVQAWETSFDQMAMQRTGKHGVKFVVNSKDIKKISDHVDFIGGTANISGGAYSPGEVTYFAYVTVLPANHMGQWMMVYSYCIVPKKALGAQGATAAAVFNSVRINFAQINANMAAFNKTMQQQFDQRFANVQEENAMREQSTQASIARADANADEMQKQAAGMENYALDRTVLADPETGTHFRVDNSSIGTPTNFQVVPPGSYIKGVDY
jgi:hypothetical protein